MQVNAKELRLHLSDYLERAAHGHSLEISMRGKVVARLSAIEGKQPPAEDALFGIWAARSTDEVAGELRAMRQGR